jgi:hypothetical protein
MEGRQAAMESLAQRGEAVRLRLAKLGIPVRVGVERINDHVRVTFEGSPELWVALAEMLASDMSRHLGEMPEDVVYTYLTDPSEA